MEQILAGTWIRLKTLLIDGFRGVVWARGGWWLVAGAALLTILARITPIPLRDPRFTLQAYAAIDQLLVTLLVAAWLINVVPAGPRGWWPVSAGWALGIRGVGACLGVSTLLLPLVLLQYGMARLAGDLTVTTRLSPAEVRLDGAFLALGVHGSLFAIATLAWAQLLRIILRPGAALFCLLVLVFTGFILPKMADDQPALTPLVGLLPDLGSLSPVAGTRAAADGAHLPVLYAVIHAAAVWALAAVLLEVLRGRGLDVERSAEHT